MTTFLAELGTPDSTPELAVSLLRGRLRAVEHVGDDKAEIQVGIAYNFELRDVPDKDKTRVALVCRVELDDEKHDAIKHLTTDGAYPMTVGIHPLIGAVAP